MRDEKLPNKRRLDNKGPRRIKKIKSGMRKALFDKKRNVVKIVRKLEPSTQKKEEIWRNFNKKKERRKGATISIFKSYFFMDSAHRDFMDSHIYRELNSFGFLLFFIFTFLLIPIPPPPYLLFLQIL